MDKMAARSIDVKVKNIKTGELIKTNIILVPMVFSGHLFAIHFVSKV